MSEPATIKTIEHGEASQLPELQWSWRRWMTLIVVVGCLVLLGIGVDRMTSPDVMLRLAAIPGMIVALKWIMLALIGLVAWCVFIYVAGATGSECVQMVAALKSTRKETTTTAPPPATLRTTPEGGAAVTTASADGELPPSERVKL